MHYTVVWLPSVTDALALIWTEAANQQEITIACDAIDRILKFSADKAGDDVGDSRRLYYDPLEIFFTFSPDDCLVTVFRVFVRK